MILLYLCLKYLIFARGPDSILPRLCPRFITLCYRQPSGLSSYFPTLVIISRPIYFSLIIMISRLFRIITFHFYIWNALFPVFKFVSPVICRTRFVWRRKIRMGRERNREKGWKEGSITTTSQGKISKYLYFPMILIASQMYDSK